MMRLRALPAILLLLLLAVLSRAATPVKTHTAQGLRYPVDITRRITSTFAELRPDRFHAGLDFSINNQIGAPAFAIDDGYVSRLKTDFTGYGLVLYYTLNSGDIAVYAHLDRFADRITERVRAEQKRLNDYRVQMWFEPGELPFKKGEVVAYCGGSGAGAPHLHFELRTPDNIPYNPVLAGLVYEDTMAPWLRRMAITPLDGDSEVESSPAHTIRWVSEGVAAPVKVYGRLGVSVETRDFQDDGWYRLGVKQLELFLDDSLRHRTVLDTFPYALNRHSRLDFDYALSREGFRRFRRLYVPQGNRLGFYRHGPARGVIDTRELSPGMHTVRVRVVDQMGNVGEAVWPIEVLADPTLPRASVPDSLPPLLQARHLPADLPYQIQLRGGTVEITAPSPPDSLAIRNLFIASPAFEHAKRLVRRPDGRYFTRATFDMKVSGWTPFVLYGIDSSGVVHDSRREELLFPLRAGDTMTWALPETGLTLGFDSHDLPTDLVAALEVLEPEDGAEARLFTLRPRDYPFLGTFDLSLRSDSAAWDSSQVLVYREHDGGRWHFLSNARSDDGHRLNARVFSFETFSVLSDTVAPEIGRATPRDGVAFRSNRPRLAVTVSDDFSGLDMERSGMTLNGDEVIWQYDPDAAQLFFEPWDDLSPGEYVWRVELWDNANNRAVLEQTFTVGR